MTAGRPGPCARLALLLLAALAACRAEPQGPPNVLMWLVDTLRADHLGCYGYERPTTPVMDGLAAEGVLFEQCHVHSNWTQPSVASLLSGCYPPDFAGNFTSQVPPGLVMASEWMREHGYDTAGFTVTVATAARYGFNQGFRIYEELDYRASPRERKHREGSSFDAARLVQGAEAWLDHGWRRARPFLLYLHSVDPHLPYESHDELPSFTGPYEGPMDGRTVTVGQALSEGYQFTAADRRHLVDLYDDEVRYNDAQLGRMLAALDERGLLEDTLIVVVSDHGEELFERGTHGHGHTNLHEELTRVPLILRWPAGLPEGVRVTGLMRGIDLAPTLLEIVGLPPLPDADGTSVLDVVRGARDLTPRRPLVLVDRAKGVPPSASAARTDDLLLFEHEQEAPGEADWQRRTELFDLAADPGAARDMLEERPAEAERLRAALTAWRELVREREQGWRAARGQVELDDAEKDALRALGYLSDGEDG